MFEDPDYEKVQMNSFEYNSKDYVRITKWIDHNLTELGIDKNKINEVTDIVLSLFEKTREKNKNNKVMGECVLRSIGEPEIIIKDNGELFTPDIEDDRLTYNVLMSCNSSIIHVCS